MDTKMLDASNAYAAALKSATGGASAGGAGDVGGSSAAEGSAAFGDMITDALRDTGAKVAQSEATAAQAVSGQADLVDVVTAMSEAELMVNTVVGVRDKVISAYKEVMKMPI